MSQNQKNYEMEDFFNRYSIFKDNLNFVQEHNSQNHSFTVAINSFADLTTKEFKARNTLNFDQVKSEHSEHDVHTAPHLKVNAPLAGVDWRQQGAVNPVRDQGQCGSCYAFSSISAIETAYALKRGTLYSLSEQQVVDCSTPYGNLGCNGGLPGKVYTFIKAKGAATQASYPYTGVASSCKGYTKSPVTISSSASVSGEAGLLSAANIGSVVVLIEADQQAFQFYSSGVFDSPCGTNVDHGVVVVGYGSNYWIVRNSWGSSWGESGYIRMVRGKNICAIGSSPSYPIV